MRHQVTPHIRELVASLRRLAAEIQPFVEFASADARSEWSTLQRLWPSNEELGTDLIDLSETDLEWMEIRVRRFGEIVRTLASSILMSAGHGAAPSVISGRAIVA